MAVVSSNSVAKATASGRKRWVPWCVLAVAAVWILFASFVLRWNVPQFLQDLFNLKYLPKLGNQTTGVILLLFGLLTSVHCVGMCGGIMLSQTLQKGGAAAESRPKTILPAFLFNIGRVGSYTVVGALVGGIGQVLTLSNTLKGLVPIIGGAFLIMMAVNLLGIFPVLRYLQIGLPNSIVKKIRHVGERSPLIVGFLVGLMPCGPMQMVQIYALGTRSILFGAVSMFLFAVGTVPGLFLLGTFSSLVTRKFSKGLLRLSVLVMVVLGLVMMDRGLTLLGVSLPSFPGVSARTSDGFTRAVPDGNVQRVTTVNGEDVFPPIEVRRDVRVVWTIRVPASTLTDCNNKIELPVYHIEKPLRAGDNTVEFVPTQAGEFPYTCWMGMIKSRIRVVN